MKLEKKLLNIYKHMKNSVFLLFLLLFYSYSVMAVGYREKYRGVLAHFNKVDRNYLKYKAALFLIDNMNGHESVSGECVKEYIHQLRSFKPKTNVGKLSRAWDNCNKNQNILFVPDSLVVTDDYLISNIDDAFTIWETSNWRKEVSFRQFCKYILPYKVSNEYLSLGWRKQLRELYGGIIEKAKNVREAYALLYKEVVKRVVNSNAYAPVALDVMSYEYMRRANCEQRCLLLVSVLRAFGIPAAKDNVLYWADYSTQGHSWVSLVLRNNKTYSMVNGSLRLMARGHSIDASHFLSPQEEKQLRFLPSGLVKFKKGVSKIYRTEFERVTHDKDAHLNLMFDSDVSNQYGMNGSVTLDSINYNKVYLCTFLTDNDWKPIAIAKSNNSKLKFAGLGKNVVYLPVVYENQKLKALSMPFLLKKNGKIHYFSSPKNEAVTETVVIDRKYPLCSYIPIQWKKLIGCVFEASNDSLFSECATLAKIEKMPLGKTDVQLLSVNQYRYVRFRNTNKDIGLLAELSFLGVNKKNILPISKNYISYHVDQNTISSLFDEDVETKVKARKPNYWIGFDAKNASEHELVQISFTPVSDGNDIQKGHLYFLCGYDNGWSLLGRSFAKANNEKLVFPNVPRNVLLLLIDRTKGKEERIFWYKNNKQVWY